VSVLQIDAHADLRLVQDAALLPVMRRNARVRAGDVGIRSLSTEEVAVASTPTEIFTTRCMRNNGLIDRVIDR
jgi:arginase family enzyme